MKYFYMAALAAILGLVSACGREEGKAAAVTAASLPVLRKAPEWTLKDVSGRDVKSSDFKGKVMLVDFWATWCAPCRKEIPEYVAWQKKYAERGLVILGMSLDEAPPAEVKQFGEIMKINYPLLVAGETVPGAYGEFEYIPTAFLVDREGNIRHMKTGPADMAAFEKLIESLL